MNASSRSLKTGDYTLKVKTILKPLKTDATAFKIVIKSELLLECTFVEQIWRSDQTRRLTRMDLVKDIMKYWWTHRTTQLTHWIIALVTMKNKSEGLLPERQLRLVMVVYSFAYIRRDATLHKILSRWIFRWKSYCKFHWIFCKISTTLFDIARPTITYVFLYLFNFRGQNSRRDRGAEQ